MNKYNIKRNQLYKNKLSRNRMKIGKQNERMFGRIAAIKNRLDKKHKYPYPTIREKIDTT